VPFGTDNQKIPLELRGLCRSRRKLIRDETAASNRIHAQVDRLFPGFLDSSKSGLTAFGPASLHLMSERFSAPEIARRSPASLTKTLRSQHVHYPEETATKLITLARSALSPTLPGSVPNNAVFRLQSNSIAVLKTPPSILRSKRPVSWRQRLTFS